MIPVVRGFDDLLINGTPCPYIQQCAFDLDIGTLDLKLDSSVSLHDLCITGDRPDIMLVVTGVAVNGTSTLRFRLDNEYQYLNTSMIRGTEFSFDILQYLGAEPCST